MKYEAKKTSARPQVVAGVTFECWQVGIAAYCWQSADGSIVARSNGVYSRRVMTYSAYADGKPIGDRFRTLSNAMRAAVKAQKKARKASLIA